MPLMTSPIDGSAMRQVRRYGVELDVCPNSGGVWLDKGELERLLALVRDEAAEAHAARSRRSRQHDDDLDDTGRRGARRRGRSAAIFER